MSGLFMIRYNDTTKALESDPGYIKTELGVSLRGIQDKNTAESI